MIHRLKLEQPLKERPWETKDGNSKALDSKKKMQEVLDKN